MPEIPDWAVKLKVDHRSSNIRIDEEPLLRALLKLRNYVKTSGDATFNVLRTELESQINGLRREFLVNIQEAVSDGIGELRRHSSDHEERLKVVEDELNDITISVSKLKGQAQMLQLRQDSQVLEDVRPASRQEPIKKQRSSMPPRAISGTIKLDEEDDDLLADDAILTRPPTRALSVAVTRGPSSLDSAPSPPPEPSRNSVLAKLTAGFASAESPASVPTPLQLASPSPDGAMKASVDSPAASKSSAVGIGSEAFAALQAEVDEAKQAVKQLEATLDTEVAEIAARLEDAETERHSNTNQVHNLDERMSSSEAEQQRLNALYLDVSGDVARFERDKADLDQLVNAQEQITELQGRIAQAAFADVVYPKIHSLTQNLEALTQACKTSDRELEVATSSVSQLYSKFDSCSEQLLQVALRTELEERCQILDQQCRGVSELLTEVQSALGDISAAVISLGSKAEYTDLAIVRDELSTFAENMKEREQSVLFGAKCLSCNRVFDDVRHEAGVVDLPGERQRDALFAQVQRALHNPSMDPLTKIKMLAVKVGRSFPVSETGGTRTYNGRDPASFACGVGDVQLVPAVRGCSIAGDDGRSTTALTRPAGTPRPGRRKPRGNEAWQGPPKDGPMDFKHPLSQLVDRGHRGGGVSALG